MSISYSICSAAHLETSAVVASFARLPGFQRTGEGVSAPDLQISIREPSDLNASIIEEAFAFRPRLFVGFRPDKFCDGQLVMDRVLMATAALMRETVEDLSLLLNGEDVILTRLQGKLVLYARPEFWTEARAKLFPEPHSFAEPLLL